MEKRRKRARGSNWNHAHTMALAEQKREAFLNKEDGRLVWERIAQTLSSRFPGQTRTGDQCRRRWDTLVKVYNHIEDYCVVTGAQDHRELDKGELASMKLDTAYQQDWYDIVDQVCSQRKRKERCDRDLMLTKRSKASSAGFHSVEHPERPPNRDTLCSASPSKSVTHHEQSPPESTTPYAQVSSSPSLEADKLSPEEEVQRLKNGNDGLTLEQSTTTSAQVSSSPSLKVDRKVSPEEEVLRLKNGNDGLMLAATQVRQHGQVSHEVSQEPLTLESTNLLPYTFPAENGALLKEPLQDDIWALVDAMPIETSAEIVQSKTESELTEPFYLDLESARVRGYWPKAGLVQHRVRDDSFDTANFWSASESNYLFNFKCQSPALPSKNDLPEWPPAFVVPSVVPPEYERGAGKGMTTACGRVCVYPPRNNFPSAAIKSSSVFVNQDGLIPSAIMASSTSSRSADSTISRQSRRWSLKVIVFNVLQCCYACGRKERVEDMEMESKQAARLKERARKKAPMSRKESVPAMFNAASSASATSATKGDKPVQKGTERTSKQAALDKKEEEPRPRKAERQQLGGKSSIKCVPPVGKLCAKLSRKLFPAFHGQSSH